MIEEWRELKDYPNYFISNLGRVKSVRFIAKYQTYTEYFLKPIKARYGYLYIGISRRTENKPIKWLKIHRLVAQYFLSNYAEDLQVNHIDENKTNNCATNLEMCNNKYNCTYGSRKTVNAKPILQYSLEGIFIREWISSREIERVLGFPHSSINACCKGKIKSHGKEINIKQAYGYVWQYK